MMTTKKKVDWRIVCTGLVCISGIEIFALSQGINGVVLSSVLMIIAATIGLSIEKPKFLKQ